MTICYCMSTTSIHCEVVSSSYIKINWTDDFFIIDRKSMIIYWNKAAEQLSGYQKNEVFGLPCEKVVKHVDEKGNEFVLNESNFDDILW